MKLLSRGAAVGAALIILAAVWAAWPAAGVPILSYHKVGDTEEAYSVAPADFERQMAYLADKGYTAITMADLFGRLTAGKPLPARPVVITFDDGYADNYYTALPIMAKYGMRATVFVVTDFLGERPYLTWDEVKALRAAGTEIGSHSLAHRALPELPADERLRDVAASKEGLEWRLDAPVRFFAYPFGRYDAASEEALQAVGYRAAVSTRLGLNNPGDDLYALKRINIPRSRWGLLEFRLRLLRANVYEKLGL
ncbi:polysaccharide deacetylase family protein [Anaeroselena agilis]|uniref:Polysaccharide deacetylase family protein n=1 Tax=Anaeroselena agilis TaxID=3063788 RepID=A0ABU3P4U7_9FIRM|nr:polysaccharide deacetylase family protein [Selenomonadales bacterium 4137-cl]